VPKEPEDRRANASAFTRTTSEDRLRRKADAARKFLDAKTVSVLQAERDALEDENIRHRAELVTSRNAVTSMAEEVERLRQRVDALQWALVMAQAVARAAQARATEYERQHGNVALAG